jgi:predicted esterase
MFLQRSFLKRASRSLAKSGSSGAVLGFFFHGLGASDNVSFFHAKIFAKVAQHAPKMVPKWSQNGAQDDVPDGAPKKLEN